MAAPRRAKSRDANEAELIRAFKALGWMVVQHDAYDLEVQCPRCRLHLSVEVKNPKTRSQRKRSGLTVSQKALQARGWDLKIVFDIAEAESLVLDHMEQFHLN